MKNSIFNKFKNSYIKLYEYSTPIIKYIGLPSLIIASILPAYNLFIESKEKIIKNHYESIYHRHIRKHIDNGNLERARNLHKSMKLISSENLNAKLLRTEINIIDSFSTGLNIDKHIDELEVLLEIEEERRFYYPSIMSLKKEVELRLMLTEVLRIGREYDLAYKQINKLKLIVDRSLDSKYLLYTEYQEILLDIRTKKTNNNPKKIVKVIDSLKKNKMKEK
ncbi:hypothetical protein JCM19236_3080 [Vibrio sp. JCM 19236]|nr:hypothetical protein JCM19236_3080 [Vibrio sp. JCM 19236]